MAVREVEALPFPFPVEEQQAVSHPGTAAAFSTEWCFQHNHVRFWDPSLMRLLRRGRPWAYRSPPVWFLANLKAPDSRRPAKMRISRQKAAARGLQRAQAELLWRQGIPEQGSRPQQQPCWSGQQLSWGALRRVGARSGTILLLYATLNSAESHVHEMAVKTKGQCALPCRAPSASCANAGCLASGTMGSGSSTYTASGTGGHWAPATTEVRLHRLWPSLRHCTTQGQIWRHLSSPVSLTAHYAHPCSTLSGWRILPTVLAHVYLSSDYACAEYVLPEKKAAAEELRIQLAASRTPSMGSAARAAAAARSEHEDRIQSLYADVCKVGCFFCTAQTIMLGYQIRKRSWAAPARELGDGLFWGSRSSCSVWSGLWHGSWRACCDSQEMLHHSGASGDYHRLVSRLSPDRLAVAMPYTATRLRSNVGPEGALTFLSASPATIACLASLLPETRATTLVLSGELTWLPVPCDLGQCGLLRRLQDMLPWL